MLDMYDRAATEGRLTINRTVSVEDLNRTRARLIELSDDNVRLRDGICSFRRATNSWSKATDG